jgi:hypothetical protein
MLTPLAAFDTKGTTGRASIPSINTDIKLARGVKSKRLFASHRINSGLRR